MSEEWGLFNDEGCVEAQFYSKAEAEAAKAERYPEEGDDLRVETVCPEHPEQSNWFCDECFFEEDEDAEEE